MAAVSDGRYVVPVPLFGKRKRPSADTSPFEAPPIEHAGADQVAASSPSLSGADRLTAEHVRAVAFGKPRIGRRGYNDLEVDAILDLVEVELSRPPSSNEAQGLTPQDVEEVRFSAPPIGKRGYNEDQVDMFLDRIAVELRHRGAQR